MSPQASVGGSVYSMVRYMNGVHGKYLPHYGLLIYMHQAYTKTSCWHSAHPSGMYVCFQQQENVDQYGHSNVLREPWVDDQHLDVPYTFIKKMLFQLQHSFCCWDLTFAVRFGLVSCAALFWLELVRGSRSILMRTMIHDGKLTVVFSLDVHLTVRVL